MTAFGSGFYGDGLYEGAVSSVLVQTAPLSDSVDAADSDVYGNQLQSSGGTGAITWTTVQSTPAFIVSPSGALGAVGPLGVGTYTATGTMEDSISNMGIWSFTLTVTPIPTPQVSVTPSQSALPTGVEIATPFQIDPSTGAVMVQSDYVAIMAQHIVSIVATAEGERVMLPTYGVGLETDVFLPVDAPSTIRADIQNQIKTWEPAVSVDRVDVIPDTVYQNVLDALIQFSVFPYAGTNTVSVTVGGSVSQMSAP